MNNIILFKKPYNEKAKTETKTDASAVVFLEESAFDNTLNLLRKVGKNNKASKCSHNHGAVSHGQLFLCKCGTIGVSKSNIYKLDTKN